MTRNNFKRTFNKTKIAIHVDSNGVYHFNLVDIAKAAGYYKTSSIEHHTKGTKYDISYETKGGNYIKSISYAGIQAVSLKATKTPILKTIALWARDIIVNAQGISIEGVQEVAPVSQVAPVTAIPKAGKIIPVKVEVVSYSIKESAEKLNITTGELSNWLISQGFADRYKGNRALYFQKWFKDQGYGMNPVLGEGETLRVSNVPRVTQNGIDFISNRLASAREAVFAETQRRDNTERQKLEQGIDDLILKSFSKFDDNMGGYWIRTSDLISTVKGVISQVKLAGDK